MCHMDGRFIAYYRVSTAQQGRSGLGLEAQREAVRGFLNGGKWELLNEFTEVESGKRSNRPQLQAALAMCKKRKATLVIGKLDRVARNLHCISGLMESKTKQWRQRTTSATWWLNSQPQASKRPQQSQKLSTFEASPSHAGSCGTERA
jgi:hypothetical protein